MSKETFLQAATLAYAAMSLNHMMPVFKYNENRASLHFDDRNLRSLLSLEPAPSEDSKDISLPPALRAAADRLWAAYSSTTTAAYNTLFAQLFFNTGGRALGVGMVAVLERMFSGAMRSASNTPVQYAVPLAMCVAAAETTSDIASALSSSSTEANRLRFLSDLSDYHARFVARQAVEDVEVASLAFLYGYAACVLCDREGVSLSDSTLTAYARVCMFLLAASYARPSVSNDQSIVLPGYIDAPPTLPYIIKVASPSWDAKLSFEALGRTFVAGASPFLKNASFMVRVSSATFMAGSTYDYLDYVQALPLEGISYAVGFIRSCVTWLLRALDTFGIRSPIYFESSSVHPDPKAETKFKLQLAGTVSIVCEDVVTAADSLITQKVREQYWNAYFGPYFFASVIAQAGASMLKADATTEQGFRPTPDQYGLGVRSVGQLIKAATDHIKDAPMLLSQKDSDLPILLGGVKIQEAFHV